MTQIYSELKKRFSELCHQQNLLDEKVEVRALTLTPEEAIGHPEEQDFPLQKGKERLMQAEFRGGGGQAFTDQFGDFLGSLKEVLAMPLGNNYRRAGLPHGLGPILPKIHLTITR